MGWFIDLTGQRFNRLIVTKRVEDHIQPNGQPSVCWLCQCDCGNRVVVRGSALRGKKTQSCGCYKKERISETHLKNLIGKRFGRLMVIERAEDHVQLCGQHKPRWLCRCVCGNEVIVEGGCLKSGHTKSCGCLNKEKITQRFLINLVGKRFGRLIVLSRAENSKPTKSSSNGDVRWLCRCDCGSEVIVRGNGLGNGTRSCGCYKTERLRELHMGKASNFWKGGGIEAICDWCGKPVMKCRSSYIISEHHFCNKSCEAHWRSVNLRGNKSVAWKGGASEFTALLRASLIYRKWRTSVFEENDYTCQKCGQKGGDLQAHHIKPFYQILKENNITTYEEALACEALGDVENGAILCEGCHLGIKENNPHAFHRLYGTRDFTEQNYHDWIKAAPMLEAV